MLASLLVALSGQVDANSCANVKKKMEKVFGVNTKEVCASLDMEPSLDNVPYVYISPDIQCDFGLQMPGLPDFGLSLGSISACEIVKAVTGPVVDKANKEMRDMARQGLDMIENQIDGVMDNIPDDARRYINNGNDVITVSP